MTRFASSIAVLCLLPLALPAPGELEALVREYNGLKPRARAGNPDQRKERALNQLRPVLVRIAKLDTHEALAFLRSEFEKESPEIAAACVGPLISISSEKALEAVVSGFQKRPRPVKEEVLVQLTGAKRDLSALEPALLGILQGETDPAVRRGLPALLARFQTVPVAKALLAAYGVPGNPKLKGADASAEAFDRAAIEALKQTKSGEVKAWLGGEAFAGASPAKLEALCILAGELKLEAARPEVEKQLDQPSERTVLKALEALLKLGAGPSASRIGQALGRERHGLSFRIQALDALGASGTEEGVAAVKEAAKAADAETRAVALGSLALVPGSNVAAYESIIAGLKDSEAMVRGAAVRALRQVRHKEMVPALIEMIALEKDERLKVDVVQLLLNLTGKNMGLAVEDWRNWWQVAELKFEFRKDKDGAIQVTASRARDLKYFGIEVSSKRLAFVLDASNSMREQVDVYLRPQKPGEEGGETGATRAVGGDGEPAPKDGAKPDEKKSGPKTRAMKIEVLKKEMARVVAELPRDTQVNIVTFSASYKPWQEALQPLAGGGRERALAFVKEIGTSSGTNVYDTLEYVLRDKRVDTVFLLTDGEPTAGKFTDGASIVREVRALNRVRGVTINCVAFGAESQFLKDLAKDNGGVYRFVNSY